MYAQVWMNIKTLHESTYQITQLTFTAPSSSGEDETFMIVGREAHIFHTMDLSWKQWSEL